MHRGGEYAASEWLIERKVQKPYQRDADIKGYQSPESLILIEDRKVSRARGFGRNPGSGVLADKHGTAREIVPSTKVAKL